MSSGRAHPENTFVLTRFLLSVFIVCFAIAASAQQSGYPVLSNADSAYAWFDKIVSSKNAAIVNGPEYHISFIGINTHPFYQDGKSNRSSVRYNNDLYVNLDLLYDTFGDILVLKTTTSSGTFFIHLDKRFVQSFDLYQHRFKKLSGAPATIGDIYFDVVFEEKQFAVLVRRIKRERLEGRKRNYFEDDVAFILNEGKWTTIKGKRSFSKNIKKDQRKALKDFIKSNHIHLRKGRDEDLKKVGAFCYPLKVRRK